MNALFACLDATWPAARTMETGPWRVREGLGGGKRVSCATTEDMQADIALAEAAHRQLGQPPLFCVRSGQHILDERLSARGYRVVESVDFYEAPVERMAAVPPAVLSSFPLWPPLAITVDLWRRGGIDPARQAVMERVATPKTAILGRSGDRAAGGVFVALAGETAMVHALYVDSRCRRTGLARNLMRAAACWAQTQGAHRLGLAVTRNNEPANALYRSLGMEVVTRCHYRFQ